MIKSSDFPHIHRNFRFTRHTLSLYFCQSDRTYYRIMDNSSIKQNIRKTRESRKLTQGETALRLGMSLSSYRDFEKGETAVVNYNLQKVADLFEISTEELVLGYRPAQLSGPALEDVRKDYTSRISVLEKRIEDLEKLVSSHAETIRTKDEIISMLRKKLGEVE